MRLYATVSALLAATLLLAALLLPGAVALAQDDPPPADEPPAQGQDGAQAEEAEEAENEAEAEEEAPPADGVLRRRPQTAEEERAWKEQQVLADPFLRIPPRLGRAQGVPDFYNPLEHIEPRAAQDISRYIIQDESGTVAGYLAIAVRYENEPSLGETVYMNLLYDEAQPLEVKLWLDAETLEPLRMVQQQHTLARPPAAGTMPGADEGGSGVEDGGEPVGDGGSNVDDGTHPPMALLQQIPEERVEYSFDLVRLWHMGGSITVHREMRQLPFSLELASLPLIMRQLKFHGMDWPFEAALANGVKLQNLPLAVGEPALATVLSAEPEQCQCYELRLQLGGREETYWVERSLPHRLVKFTDNGRTYNLFEYARQ